MFGTTASVSPLLPPWKEPVPTKDYMRENYQHIRKLAQTNKHKTDGLKPTFIPGVTKNPKYGHVQSRVADFLKGGGDGRTVAFKTQSIQSSTSSSAHSRLGLAPVKAIPARNSRSSEKPSVPSNESTKPIWGASIAANARRISKSTTDLSQKSKPAIPLRNHSLRRRPQPLQVQDESVYNWHFSDTTIPQSVQHSSNDTAPRDRYMHRVEYLPCDGICAEEEVPVKGEPGKDDSARSSSSSRTSRGVNTDETRIFQDSSFKKPLMKPVPSNGARFVSSENFPQAQLRHNDREDSGIEKDFSNLAIEDNNTKYNLTAGTNIKATSSQTSQSTNTNTHRPGVVPSYLRQRQQEWKTEEEAKKEAEKNADVPTGHVLMSDAERKETLKTVKANYDKLIADLNRLPVGVDTYRVREERIKIEDNLTKLEQAMKIFSRPRVFVKMDQ